jgi:hypothetical protein
MTTALYPNYEAAFEKVAMEIKLAAMVDELVGIACMTKEAMILVDFVDYLTPQHEEMLKEAFGVADIKGALQGAGQAIAGGARKAVGAVQGAGQSAMNAVKNMGAGGAAMRMQAAGAAHDLDKMHFGGNQFGAAPTAMQAQAAMPAMKHTIDPRGARPRPAYNPQQVSQGLLQQDLARSRADILASSPSPVPAGQVRYNPLDISAARVGAVAPRVAPPTSLPVPAGAGVSRLPTGRTQPIPGMGGGGGGGQVIPMRQPQAIPALAATG